MNTKFSHLFFPGLTWAHQYCLQNKCIRSHYIFIENTHKIRTEWKKLKAMFWILFIFWLIKSAREKSLSLCHTTEYDFVNKKKKNYETIMLSLKKTNLRHKYSPLKFNKLFSFQCRRFLSKMTITTKKKFEVYIIIRIKFKNRNINFLESYHQNI